MTDAKAQVGRNGLAGKPAQMLVFWDFIAFDLLASWCRSLSIERGK